MPAEKWPFEREAKLRFLLRERLLSTSQIAAELRVTRNSVIGKMTRLGLTGSGLHPPRKFFIKPRPQPQEVPVPVVLKPRFADHPWRPAPGKVATPRPLSAEAASGVGIEIVDLTDDTCRWPLWADRRKPEEPRLYCGCQVRFGSAYCSRHFTVSRVPKNRRD
jgi:GcrA cell cycle regulator